MLFTRSDPQYKWAVIDTGWFDFRFYNQNPYGGPIMAKYLIVLAGLLGVCSLARAECYYEAERCAKLEADKQEMYAEAAARREKIERESYMPDPVTVNGPDGLKMYYPNSDGTYWQTYDR